MRIVVVGPGAMGCLFAGCLGAAGQEVWLLDKDRARAGAIREKGIRIDAEAGSRVVRVRATVEAGEIGRADRVFLFVKSYDTVAAMDRAAPLAGSETVVVSLQNGAGNVEQVMRRVAAANVLCGTTSHGSTSLGWGHVRHAGAGPTLLAAVDPGRQDSAQATARVLLEAGFDTRVVADWRAIVWSKLVVNAAINPLTAVSGVRNGELLGNEELRRTLREAAVEAAAVARAKGIGLLYEDEVAEVERVCRATSANISSMLQDVRNGRRTEIDAISGAIVEEGRTLGMATPANRMLLDRVRKLEKVNSKGKGKTA